MMTVSAADVRCCVCVVAAALAVTVLSGCADVARLVTLAPRQVAPGGSVQMQVQPVVTSDVDTPQLPPEQGSDAFDFEAAGTDGEGRPLYRVRIGPGGSPAAVALMKLTPLFSANGRDAVQYVSDAYFQSHPERSPSTIQPGDEFILALPPDTFVVRWSEERQENFGHPTRVREYVSERGDRLRFYPVQPFPVRYELTLADRPGASTIQFDPDLPYLLTTGRTDAYRLTRLIYRVANPDIFQFEATQRLVASVRPGEAPTLRVDRTRAHFDPVRNALPNAVQAEPVSAPERANLVRYMFSPAQGLPFAMVEDGLGTRNTLNDLPQSQVFRIEYGWEGVVRVYYLTGLNDAMGRRDPYMLRENERWAALYESEGTLADPPVKWGQGEPADLEPFPTARDPNQRSDDPSRAYDYLVPGRVIVLTFNPTRFQSNTRAEEEFGTLLDGIRDRYRPYAEEAMDLVQQFQAVVAVASELDDRPAEASPGVLDGILQLFASGGGAGGAQPGQGA
ncbi:MAG: hypothetical protein GEU73_05820 [Chloroflexi bacterium]|nr:hypothetical protein [Chloroflexota bacterium]